MPKAGGRKPAKPGAEEEEKKLAPMREPARSKVKNAVSSSIKAASRQSDNLPL